MVVCSINVSHVGTTTIHVVHKCQVSWISGEICGSLLSKIYGDFICHGHKNDAGNCNRTQHWWGQWTVPQQ